MKNLILITLGVLLLPGIQLCNAYSFTNAQTMTTIGIYKENPKTVKLKITGMTCAGCSNHISKALKEVNGVLEQKVEYPGDVATIKYDASKTSLDEIIKVIEKTGYKARVIEENKVKK